MEKFIELFRQFLAGIEDRLTKLESRTGAAPAPLFGLSKPVKVSPPEEAHERYSVELGQAQQFRPKHGDGIFLTKFDSRGLFVHSLDTIGGSKHVHLAGAVYQDGDSIYNGWYVGSQLRLNGDRLQLIEYVASSKAPDVRHPNFETDSTIRILSVRTLAKDGQFVIDDTNERMRLD